MKSWKLLFLSCSVCLLQIFLTDPAEAIFFTTIGLTGTAATTATVTQSAALLPVLGLLALAAKVVKLKLSNEEEEEVYVPSYGGGYGGGGHGGGGQGGGYGYSGGHGGGHSLSLSHGGGGHGGGYGHGGGHISSGYGHGGHGRSFDRKSHKRARVHRHRQKRETGQNEALEEIFKTINMLVSFQYI